MTAERKPQIIKIATPDLTGAMLGDSLRSARKRMKLSQKRLAETSKLDLETVKNLERGVGTIGSLSAIMEVLQLRFADNPDNLRTGDWIRARRKALGMTQHALAERVGVSKPTIIGLESSRGRLSNFLIVAEALDLSVECKGRNGKLHHAKLFHGDCLQVMPTLESGSVNVIIADLPYNVTRIDWDTMIPLEPLWAEYRRLLAPKGVIVLTACQPFSSLLVTSNPDWFKYALVWQKTRKTGFTHAKTRPLKEHEDVLVFSNGTIFGAHRSQRQMAYNPQGLIELPNSSRTAIGTDQGTRTDGRHFGGSTFQNVVKTHTNYPTSILQFPSHSPLKGERTHPTQKPVELLRYLVRTYSNSGDTVMDNVMGSGTTGVAALLEGRKFIGIEQNAEYFQLSKDRIEAVASGAIL